MNNTNQPYTTFNKADHLKPRFSKETFNGLHDWDFGWEVLEPINITSDDDDEVQLATRLSPGQKALYFFWYLDGQVTNGGFVQFYCNGYRKYLSPIIVGLNLIGDKELIHLLEKVEKQFIADESIFEAFWANDQAPPPYKKLEHFGIFDDEYFNVHDRTMSLIEDYTRKNADEFVELY